MGDRWKEAFWEGYEEDLHRIRMDACFESLEYGFSAADFWYYVWKGACQGYMNFDCVKAAIKKLERKLPSLVYRSPRELEEKRLSLVAGARKRLAQYRADCSTSLSLLERPRKPLCVQGR